MTGNEKDRPRDQPAATINTPTSTNSKWATGSGSVGNGTDTHAWTTSPSHPQPQKGVAKAYALAAAFGGGDVEHVVDRFDSNDLVAITLLSVSLRPHGAMNLLTDPDGNWARLLSLIPRDARLENPGSDALIEEGGPAWELWERLVGTKRYPSKPDGSGPVVAGKLLARKRPHLIPIYDIRIKELFERPKVDHSFWAALAAVLRADNGACRCAAGGGVPCPRRGGALSRRPRTRYLDAMLRQMVAGSRYEGLADARAAGIGIDHERLQDTHPLAPLP
ncbi:DUF6308 family protein [Streptomyces endocoffeicus]|uniref:DUF6308 family protein n=1 Tax=Streptomyces endocoffeicus TaxID=2898945 RepID=UPI0027DD2838|nr:DUF6308 family protein [Streptomyces endocoffeicus]